MDSIKQELERIKKQIKEKTDRKLSIEIEITNLTKRKLELQKLLNNKN